AIWLTGRLYPYEDDNIALFFDIAGAPVWQNISVGEVLPPPADSISGGVTTRACTGSDSAKLGMRAGFGMEFPLRSVLIMHAQVGLDHYRLGNDTIDGCGTAGNDTTFFAGRLGFAVATGRIKRYDT